MMSGHEEKSASDELGSYLANDFNLEICEIVSRKGVFRFTTQLKFFQWVYREYYFIKARRSSLNLVQDRLEVLDQARHGNPNDRLPSYVYGEGADIKLLCILSSLAMLIRNECEVDGEIQDKELRGCLILIEQKLENLLNNSFKREDHHTRTQIMKEVRSIVAKRKFDFSKVKKHIESLPDPKARLQYLIEINSEYLQEDLVDENISQDFGKKCRLEINKLERFVALESQSESGVSIEVTTRNPKHTLARRVLTITSLLQYAKIGGAASKADITRFIEFLTGQNYDNIYKRVLEPFKAGRRDTVKDLIFVKEQFQKLGATDIARMIDNQINNRNDFEGAKDD